jgi:CheY-like chemotaxis protein
MADGGILTIAAEARNAGPSEHPDLMPGRYVRLTVTDTGIGMDEATLGRAVEPFFSTKGIGKGTGLGLSMAHGLASQLGGALGLASQPNLGTRVELWLPVAPTPPKREPQDRSASRRHRAAGTVLLVDDEPLVRASTADMLAELGYGVIEASSAKEALQRLDEMDVEMVVSDHLMPGLSGTELAHVIRDCWPGMPVLIISGYADIEGISADLPRLSKPFRQADLAAALDEARERGRP